MNRIARLTQLAVALSALAGVAAAVAQDSSQADQDRRARNVAEVLAKHPEARRQMSGPQGAAQGRAQAGKRKELIADPVTPVGRKAYGATMSFAERQKAKLRRIGKRIDKAVPPKPSHSQ